MAVVLVPTAVVPGVEMLSVRTPTLPPATHTNAYLLGERELVLVEPASGFAEEVDRIVGWVEARCAAGARVRAVVLTHHHADHVAGASAVSGRLRAPLWAHEDTARLLPRGVVVHQALDDQASIALDEGRTLRVIHTPGHAPGHVCLLDSASGMLVAGDMVAGIGTILVAPGDGDMAQYLASLARMEALGAAQLLPAHGLPITDPSAKLKGYIAHRLAREARVLEALRGLGKPCTIAELVPAAYADTPPMAWPLAALSSEAHLVKLEHEGKVERVGARFRAL